MKILAAFIIGLTLTACATYWVTADGSQFDNGKFTRAVGYCREYARQQHPACYNGSTHCSFQPMEEETSFNNCMNAQGFVQGTPQARTPSRPVHLFVCQSNNPQVIRRVCASSMGEATQLYVDQICGGNTCNVECYDWHEACR